MSPREHAQGAVAARVLLVVLVAAMGLLVVAAVYLARSGLKPPWYAPGAPGGELPVPAADGALFETWMGRYRDPREEYGYVYEDVSFPAEDDSVLRGWFVRGRSADQAIITVHGCGTDRRGLLKVLPILHDAGYHVLMFDTREHGVSDGQARGCSAGVREHEDILAAIRFLGREHGIREIALMGASQGASAALMAAPKSDAVRALIAESPFTDLETLLTDRGIPSWIARPLAGAMLISQGGLDTPSPIERAREIDVPVLLMHGRRDRTVPPHHADSIYDALPSAAKERWLPNDGYHVHLYNAAPQAYGERVRAFLDAYFPIGTPD